MSGEKPDFKRQLDELIWVYENYRTCAGKRIEGSLAPAELAKVLGRRLAPGETEHPREVEYRGKTLVCIGGGK